ncbi:MAG: HEPN domain-containing protein [Bacteroidales bacterium]|nr:HEPN domain-containing protein [Bacteroidales bacterium]
MKPSDEERKAIVEQRVRRAYDTWNETRGIVEGGYWLAAANRMYYACYYLTTALLASHNIAANTHTGVIRMLGMHFVSKGLISKDMGHYYGRLFEMRQSGDYDDWVMLGEGDIMPLFKQMKDYFDSVEPLIKRD